MPQRRFRFGVVADQSRTFTSLLETARRAEAVGCSTLLIRDHFVDEPFGPQLAPLTALAAVACMTTTLRIGSLVLDNDYRHPAVLAKEAASLDLLSGGRLELGLGAGWLAAEYHATGIPFDPVGTRIGRLEESLVILKGLLAGGEVTLHGNHYQIERLTNFPRPVQRPRPPILLGGGARRMLTLAGREADIVNVMTSSVANGSLSSSPDGRSFEAVAERVGWVRDGAADRFPDVELSLFPDLVLTERDPTDSAQEYATRHGWQATTAAQVLDMPSVLIGSVETVADRLYELRERLGFSYVILGEEDLRAAEPLVERLAGH